MDGWMDGRFAGIHMIGLLWMPLARLTGNIDRAWEIVREGAWVFFCIHERLLVAVY